MKPISEQINKHLDKFLMDLESGRKIAFCMRKHAASIQLLLDDGITIKMIHNATSEKHSISYEYFRKALAKARKSNQTNKQIVNSKFDNLNKDDAEATKLEQPVKNSDADDWINAFGLTPSKAILPVLITELEKHGWNPENYHKLKDKLGIDTDKKLRSLIATVRDHKASRKEYSDD